ncbi:hypothetical protein ACFFKU_04355 [Kineococcus gynurae]|uniref:Uncharacterized protein n=1 Tax=Kineococcus gynurae TaxID=452979 RepID=A0ABV5LRF9_9ACTN
MNPVPAPDSTGPADEQARWRAVRAANAQAQAARAEQARAAEAAEAARLLAGFVTDLRAGGISPVDLRATDARGWRLPTGRSGWYLRRDETLAVGTHGEFLVLTVVLPWWSAARARRRGLPLAPAEPVLQIGRGARDGESIALPDLLALRRADLLPRT